MFAFMRELCFDFARSRLCWWTVKLLAPHHTLLRPQLIIIYPSHFITHSLTNSLTIHNNTSVAPNSTRLTVLHAMIEYSIPSRIKVVREAKC